MHKLWTFGVLKIVLSKIDLKIMKVEEYFGKNLWGSLLDLVSFYRSAYIHHLNTHQYLNPNFKFWNTTINQRPMYCFFKKLLLMNCGEIVIDVHISLTIFEGELIYFIQENLKHFNVFEFCNFERLLNCTLKVVLLKVVLDILFYNLMGFN